jgi:hypothetical protein
MRLADAHRCAVAWKKEVGLDRLTAPANSRALGPQELVNAYHFCFYNTLARSVFAEYAELSQMTGVTQDSYANNSPPQTRRLYGFTANEWQL